MSPTREAEIFTLPIPPEGLSAAQYREIERALKDWEKEVRDAIAASPKRSYELGVQQTLSFLRLLGRLGQADLPPSGVVGPGQRLAVEWLKRYTLHEIDGALNKYLDDIRSAILYGLQGGVNPTQVASWMYKATQDAGVNWRTVARTEMVRANAAGRLDSVKAMGYEQVWAPKHTGACKQCRRLLEDQVFNLDEVRNATNYGKPVHDWVACIPLHPHCRHVWLPYTPEVFEEAQREYQSLAENGLDDATLDEMFESSGQLKPEYENDPRLVAFFEETGKTVDPLQFALGQAIAKSERWEPPGLRHTSSLKRRCHTCAHVNKTTGTCHVTDQDHNGPADWPVDRDEVCDLYEPEELGKGYFDNPQAGLDPLLWRDEKLRADVRDRIVTWWRHTFTDDAPLWSKLYVTGSAASRAWEGKRMAGDVDLQVVVDYDALRKHHPEYRTLSDPELHAALVTQVRASLDGVEAAPGLALDAFIRPERTGQAFALNTSRTGQGVWSVHRNKWLVTPPHEPVVEDLDHGLILEGEGGQIALEHPDWLQQARSLNRVLSDALARGDDLSQDELHELQDAYTQLHDLREAGFKDGPGARGLGNFLWQYLMTFGPLARVKHLLHPTPLSKIWPGYEAVDEWVAKDQYPAPGTEHWITIHPHGEDEKGIPVLIRENGDGTASVIGGAGGHLDFLRISHSSRIEGQGKPKAKPVVQQAQSEEEAAANEAAVEQARQTREQARSIRDQHQQSIDDYVKNMWNERGQVGEETRSWDQLDDADRQKLLTAAYHTAHVQAGYGSIMDRSINLAGPLRLSPQKVKDEEGNEREENQVQDTAAPELQELEEQARERTPAKPRIPLLALSTDESENLLGLYEARSQAHRQIRSANRVINGEGKPTDASSVEWQPWTDPKQINEAGKRRWERLSETELKRTILNQIEGPRVNKEAKQAIERGTFDAFDAVTYSVFGKTALPTRVQRLLKTSGTAQLLAYEFQQRARAGQLDLQNLKHTIDQITDERQRDVLDVNVNRAKYALSQATAMSEEEQLSKEGESAFTVTQAISRRSKKLREASNALGMGIAGSEALHTLRSILEQPVDRIEVPGFASKGQIMDLAARARIKVNDSDVVRVGAGNYTLRISPDRFEKQLTTPPTAEKAEKEFLSRIRTGKGLDDEIEQTRTSIPGYSRTLDRAQAQGVMYLQHAKSALLAFAPGVGKTDTTLAAFSKIRAEEPDKNHRLLVIAPATAVSEDGAWPSTVRKAFPGLGYEVVDAASERQRARAEKTGAPLPDRAPVMITSMDWIKANPDVAKSLGHTYVAADESQYAKSEKSQRLSGLEAAGQADGVEGRWALSGTPLEKNMGELYSQMNWARPGEYGSREAFNDRYGELGQWDHMTSEEQAQQFRESLSNGLFHQGQNMSGMPALTDMDWADAPLTQGHQDVYRNVVQNFNQTRSEILARRKYLREEEGMTASQAVAAAPKMPYFGGHHMQVSALEKPEKLGYLGPNARAQKVAQLVANNKPVKFKGFKGHAVHPDGSNAGTYAPKSIVFHREVQPLATIEQALNEQGSHKVFFTRGGDAEKNDKVLQDFMAHDGPAVLLTTDTNKTARSLQFGDNGGTFQHGATQVIHADVPQNNADLQQRVARAWRRGAQAKVSQHVVYSGMPGEQRMREQLERELRSQQQVGNPEDLVGGKQTMGQKLERQGQKRLKPRTKAKK